MNIHDEVLRQLAELLETDPKALKGAKDGRRSGKRSQKRRQKIA
jgi:hypothetical protein